jgi:hypothetical protein
MSGTGKGITMLRLLAPALMLLAACAPAEPAAPVAARLSGTDLIITLANGRDCRLTLPETRSAELEAGAACRPVRSVRVHAAPGEGEPVVLFQFAAEFRLQNDGPPLWVWVGTERGTYLFSG